MQEAKFFKKWWIFINERFPLSRHLPVIIFYFSANLLVAVSSSGAPPVWKWKEVLSGLIVLFIFFHLRIFDEIKDYRIDSSVHKERPLARGLIKVKEAKYTAFGLIFLELSLAIMINKAAVLSAVCTILYSLIMYKEFFVGGWLRPKMATYALVHTLESCWLSVFIYSAVTGFNFWEITPVYGTFVLANWMIFNIFEFSRKTFGKEEEKDLVESYSKRLGSRQAAITIIFMASVAIYVAWKLGSIFNLSTLFNAGMYLLYDITLISAGLYVVYNDKISAKILRGSCSVFILFYNVIITLAILWKH